MIIFKLPQRYLLNKFISEWHLIPILMRDNHFMFHELYEVLLQGLLTR